MAAWHCLKTLVRWGEVLGRAVLVVELAGGPSLPLGALVVGALSLGPVPARALTTWTLGLVGLEGVRRLGAGRRRRDQPRPLPPPPSLLFALTTLERGRATGKGLTRRLVPGEAPALAPRASQGTGCHPLSGVTLVGLVGPMAPMRRMCPSESWI